MGEDIDTSKIKVFIGDVEIKPMSQQFKSDYQRKDNFVDKIKDFYVQYKGNRDFGFSVIKAFKLTIQMVKNPYKYPTKSDLEKLGVVFKE